MCINVPPFHLETANTNVELDLASIALLPDSRVKLPLIDTDEQSIMMVLTVPEALLLSKHVAALFQQGIAELMAIDTMALLEDGDE